MGDFFRTTPDGREGWFTSFARRGFAVYSVNGANRGRAGLGPHEKICGYPGTYSAFEHGSRKYSLRNSLHGWPTDGVRLSAPHI